ncbi:MAG: hypothetical protein Q8M92_01225 [Candidatus Subteraquimicrobiales bacterium]|nr:hypothetical protein [Candidatus Subteraquimicrobiales bacterium]
MRNDFQTEFEGYTIKGIDQAPEFLEYTKEAVVHGNLEYGTIYDNETGEEYAVRINHNKKTISITEGSLF